MLADHSNVGKSKSNNRTTTILKSLLASAANHFGRYVFKNKRHTKLESSTVVNCRNFRKSRDFITVSGKVNTKKLQEREKKILELK